MQGINIVRLKAMVYSFYIASNKGSPDWRLLCSQDDPPPEFYEFGLEDYVRVQQGISRAAKHAEAGLRTAKLREQEERQKASRFPKCTLRILFPDGVIMQACQFW